MSRIAIRVTVTAEVTDADALARAALALVNEAAANGDGEVDVEALADLRAAIPDDPAAAVVALVDPEAPMAEIPGVTLVGVDVEVGPEELAIELP